MLVVEDDVQLADAMASVLADELDVVVAHDGATALELVEKYQPQLLVKLGSVHAFSANNSINQFCKIPFHKVDYFKMSKIYLLHSCVDS